MSKKADRIESLRNRTRIWKPAISFTIKKRYKSDGLPAFSLWTDEGKIVETDDLSTNITIRLVCKLFNEVYPDIIKRGYKYYKQEGYEIPKCIQQVKQKNGVASSVLMLSARGLDRDSMIPFLADMGFLYTETAEDSFTLQQYR